MPGLVLLALGLLAVVFGVVKGETWGWTSAGTLGSVAAGLVLLLVFGRYETRVEHPLLPMRLFRNRALTIGAVITALNFFVMLYLQNVRGLTPVEAGVRTLPLSLASLVASPVGAALTQRFGPRLTMPLGTLLQATTLQIGGALGTSVLVMNGVHVAVIVTVVLCVLGAVLAAVGLRPPLPRSAEAP